MIILNNLKILWNPWRFEYVSRAGRERECILCELPKREDSEAYILYRGEWSYVVLNAYPYNSGHVMIATYRHVGMLENLTREELSEITELMVRTVATVKKAFNPDGFNIGLNIGRAAGAGVADHIHIHVVPRWVGDTNFIAIISGTKPLPIALNEVYVKLRECWS